MAITGSIGMGLGAVLIFFRFQKVAVSYRYFCFCGMTILSTKVDSSEAENLGA